MAYRRITGPAGGAKRALAYNMAQAYRSGGGFMSGRGMAEVMGRAPRAPGIMGVYRRANATAGRKGGGR